MKHDQLEAKMDATLIRLGIPFTRPDKTPHSVSTLDFHLTGINLSVEVKAWSCERLHDQLRRSGKEREGIVVLIGENAVDTFCHLLQFMSHPTTWDSVVPRNG